MRIYIEEKNASEKICPLSFVRGPVTRGCVGDLCAAWRWGRTNIRNTEDKLVPSDDTYGFCGLAGKPDA